MFRRKKHHFGLSSIEESASKFFFITIYYYDRQGSTYSCSFGNKTIAETILLLLSCLLYVQRNDDVKETDGEIVWEMM